MALEGLSFVHDYHDLDGSHERWFSFVLLLECSDFAHGPPLSAYM
jgi:hypothetical protein